MGCWAIGGRWNFNGVAAGWGRVDDGESTRALRTAYDLGVTFFDTAANYGAGRSEELVGEAFRGHRDDVVIATKFGYMVDRERRSVVHYDSVEEESDVASRLQVDVAKSLRRLKTDYIDVYLLHIWGLSLERAFEVREALEGLVDSGTVRTYGWSTDRVDAVRAFASEHSSCSVVEQELSVLNGDQGMLGLCDEFDLASVNRAPLGMGLLTGKFRAEASFAEDDVRRVATWHPGFVDGRPSRAWLSRIDALREVLQSDGRTLAQGAVAWIWGRSSRTIPIPGFKTCEQVRENCGAMDKGPLTATQMNAVAEILADFHVATARP
jgi:aryl-alcohol dehydrogenase-like predicted oxidoreductase